MTTDWLEIKLWTEMQQSLIVLPDTSLPEQCVRNFFWLYRRDSPRRKTVTYVTMTMIWETM